MLDSYIYEFALKQANLPFLLPKEGAGEAESFLWQFPAEAHPHLTKLTIQHGLQPGYDDIDEFAPGLALILDGLECIRDTA